MTLTDRSFEEWTRTLSKKHKHIVYEHGPIPSLTQIYFILLDNIMDGKKNCNPTTSEIIQWVEIGKILDERTIHRKSHQKAIVMPQNNVIIPTFQII